MARRPRKVSRRKAQGSGFKGSGFRLFKVLAAQGFGLGLKAEGSGFRLQGFGFGRARFGVWGLGFRVVG